MVIFKLHHLSSRRDIKKSQCNFLGLIIWYLHTKFRFEGLLWS